MESELNVFEGGPQVLEHRNPWCRVAIDQSSEALGEPLTVLFGEPPTLEALMPLLDILIVGLENLSDEERSRLWVMPDTSTLPPGLSSAPGALALATMLFPGRFSPSDPVGGIEVQALFASLSEVIASPRGSGDELLLLLLSGYSAGRWRVPGAVRNPHSPNDLRPPLSLDQ